MHSSSSLSSGSFVDEEDDKSEGNCREEGGNSSPNSGTGKKKKTANNNGGFRIHRFSCLSRKGFIIGLPKVPDTRFRSPDFAARIRCRITGKGCKKPSFSFIPKEALGDSRISGNKGGGINSFKTYEPGSPDVSCIGRIKLKTKEAKKLKTLTSARREDQSPRKPQGNGKLQWWKNLCNFGWRKVESPVVLPDSRVGASGFPQNVRDIVEEEESSRAFVPRLADLKRFASQREPAALPDSRGAGDIVEEESSHASVPRLSDLKRFASQREPAALSNLIFQDTDARERQQPVAESGDDQVMESNFSEENEINGKLCENSKPAEEEGLKEEMAGIDVHSNCSQVDTVGARGSARTPPCEINLWKRRSVAAPTALELETHHYGFDMRKPLTV